MRTTHAIRFIRSSILLKDLFMNRLLTCCKYM